MKSAFDQFTKAERYSEAAEFGLQLAKQTRADELAWLSGRARSGSGRRSSGLFRFLCSHGAAICGDKSARSRRAGGQGHAVATQLDRSPETSRGIPGQIAGRWNCTGLVCALGFWLPRLLAYRSGDAESAVKYVKRSEELKPHEFAHAFNLAVRAMAEHRLRHPEEARRALEAASQLINRFEADAKNKGIPAPLDVQTLYREAEALLSGKTKP